MTEKRRFSSFVEFWPFYVEQHALPVTRRLHFVGTTLVAACFAGAILWKGWLVLLAPFAGYGFAWLGHFGFERNKPATFKYPFYSFAADWVLWGKMLTGRMDEEARRILGVRPEARPS